MLRAPGLGLTWNPKIEVFFRFHSCCIDKYHIGLFDFLTREYDHTTQVHEVFCRVFAHTNQCPVDTCKLV